MYTTLFTAYLLGENQQLLDHVLVRIGPSTRRWAGRPTRLLSFYYYVYMTINSAHDLFSFDNAPAWGGPAVSQPCPYANWTIDWAQSRALRSGRQVRRNELKACCLLTRTRPKNRRTKHKKLELTHICVWVWVWVCVGVCIYLCVYEIWNLF